MCGINAIFCYRPDAPPVDVPELLRTRDAMASRGADNAGMWCREDGRIGLAHQRLAIIDLGPSGDQPMFHDEGQLAIVFNGEIYNYQAIRAELIAAGCRLRSHCDTEVILHLYHLYGPACVERLRGMFAFALWDGARRGLFLARDPFGIKPLYLADDGGTLRVASQVKALLSGGAIDTRPEPAGHVGFFLWGHVPDPYTLFRGVRSLPAGTTLWLGADGKREERRYFSLRETLGAAAPGPVDLREALFDSVRHHLVSDVPVGLFLSAGRDSSTVAALMAEAAGPGIEMVTLGFDRGNEIDEVPYAAETARGLGGRHHARRIGRADFEAELPHIFAAMDQPSTDGVNGYFGAREASAAGLKVAISGTGGDDLFAGHPAFAEMPPLVSALGFTRFLPGLGRGFRVVAAPILRRFVSPKYASLFEYGGSYSGAYLLRRALFMPWELPEILDGEMVREGWAELQPLLHFAADIEGLTRPHQKIMALEIINHTQSRLLRDADWAGGAHSLEIRTPYLDADLVRKLAPAFAGDHPPHQRDMFATVRDKLPPSLAALPKTGFVAPVEDWVNGEAQDGGERGFRRWARRVYRECYGALAA